jgi:hypothetical protein
MDVNQIASEKVGGEMCVAEKRHAAVDVRESQTLCTYKSRLHSSLDKAKKL